MYLNSASESLTNIPPAVHEFVAILSGGRVIDKVDCLKNTAEVIELLLNEFTTLQNLHQQQVDAIALITQPYLEREEKVNISIVQDTMYIYDSEEICISFVKPTLLAQQLTHNLPLIAIDGVHAGTSIPEIVKNWINPKIITDKPMYQANPETALRQSDVGVKELIGKLWQTNEYDRIPVMGSAFFWNLIICNGNRPIPSEEESNIEYLQTRKIDCWLTTQTYRGDFIYQDNQLPSQEVRNQIQRGHSFSIKVAGAVRGSLYLLSQTPPIIIEPHSYSGFSHPFLNKYLSQSEEKKNWIEIAKQEDGLRPLLSVLDVQKADEEGYWTTTPQEADKFYQAFLEVLKQHQDKLPASENIPESQNDVYGYGGGILTRLTQVVEQASNYAEVDQAIIHKFYQHNIFTVEINRLLLQLSEFEDVSSMSGDVYYQRCDIVGSALIKGIEAIVSLISQRLTNY
jgi:hypothetical protein